MKTLIVWLVIGLAGCITAPAAPEMVAEPALVPAQDMLVVIMSAEGPIRVFIRAGELGEETHDTTGRGGWMTVEEFMDAIKMKESQSLDGIKGQGRNLQK